MSGSLKKTAGNTLEKSSHDEMPINSPKVAIIGSGLVGPLLACLMAKRGFSVDVFEMRPDLRKSPALSAGKSINLALSVRGIHALSLVGLEQKILTEHAIPMKGRLIHDPNGTRKVIRYGQNNQHINSVSRRYLNDVLLSTAEKHKGVRTFFQHKLVSANFSKGVVTCKTQNGVEETVVEYGGYTAIIGCDGAHSKVRAELGKMVRLDYQQQYIEHGYMELCIDPTSSGDFAMEINYLHIWPRGEFMLIALPNQDRTYTVTLFMPFERFEQLKTDEDITEFFETYFKDAIPLIGRENIIKTFHEVGPSPLLMIKCAPYHFEGKGLLLGDAAHAMVPFYGQGMNCGFEDCSILDALFDQYGANFEMVFSEFTRLRNDDAKAICDLALYNYVEMRHMVNLLRFRIRKRFDTLLNRIFPNWWVPLYSSVTFTRMPYRQCINNRNWQDKMIDGCLTCISVMVVLTPIIFAATSKGFSGIRQFLQPYTAIYVTM